MRYHDDGSVAAYDGPALASSASAAGREAMGFPQSVVLTPHTEMSMKYMVEISRGCPCMCRFCWAGYNYLPVRGFTRAELVARAREVRRLDEQDRPRVDRGLRPPRDRRHRRRPRGDGLRGLGRLAAPRRPDPGFVLKLADTGVQGLTLAPECGSDRMRRVINKQFTNADILDKATWIFENGIQNLKLYYMVGLPFEEHADVEAIASLTERDPRAHARGRARARAHRPAPPLGQPLRAQAGDALPVAADGGPEGVRPQAPVPAQGLRPHAERGRDLKSARTAPRSRSSPSATGGWPTPSRSRRRERMDFKRAVREAGLDPSFYLFREPRRETRSCPGTSSTTGSRRPTSGRSSSAASGSGLSPHCPEIQGCIRCGVCVETPNPLYKLPEKWKALGTPPRYL